MKVHPDEQSHGLSMQRKILQHTIEGSDDLGLRSPVIQNTFPPKSAASMVARVRLRSYSDGNSAWPTPRAASSPRPKRARSSPCLETATTPPNLVLSEYVSRRHPHPLTDSQPPSNSPNETSRPKTNRQPTSLVLGGNLRRPVRLLYSQTSLDHANLSD